jgi:hypothetical protein
MWRHVALVRTVSEQRIASIFRLNVISKLGTTVAVRSRIPEEGNISARIIVLFAAARRLFLGPIDSTRYLYTGATCQFCTWRVHLNGTKRSCSRVEVLLIWSPKYNKGPWIELTGKLPPSLITCTVHYPILVDVTAGKYSVKWLLDSATFRLQLTCLLGTKHS